ncbi:putative transcription factor C2H2 family [Helianthus annuus]|nr:putative transcription factor C2H2 family [Helianthus annuus]
MGLNKITVVVAFELKDTQEAAAQITDHTTQPTIRMANKDTVKKPSKSTPRMPRTSVRTEPEVGNSSKKRKKASAKVKLLQNQTYIYSVHYLYIYCSSLFCLQGVDEERKWCHQCRTVKEPVVDCTKCYSKRYCLPCITKWYPHVSEEEFVKACPVCCNYCNCKACLRRFSPKVGFRSTKHFSSILLYL